MTLEDNTTKSPPDFIDILNNVHGFISLAEAKLLYTLASQVPSGGNIVEIGAYCGRSTIALALGAKVNGVFVWSIDPHPTYEAGGTQYGMADNQEYYHNIAYYRVGDVVRTINLPSTNSGYAQDTDLLWIDGSHVYKDVEWDFRHYSRMINPYGDGKIALHDTAGFHPGVTQLVNEILAAGQWKISQRVDAISVLERVK